MCIIARARHVPFLCAFQEAEKHTLCILFAYTQKRPHILVTAPLFHATLSIHLTAQKRP